MPLQPNSKYNVTVGFASFIESQNTGTPGIQITFECEEGSIEHTIWVTPKSREFAVRDLKTLGIREQDLSSMPFLENIGTALLGAECSITTFEDEYKGKKKLKVQWINDKRKAASGSAVSRAASLLGGSPVTVPADDHGITDEDVPF